MKITLFMVLLGLLFQVQYNTCISDWFVIWEFPSHVMCSEQEPWGDYTVQACKIVKYSDYHGEYETYKRKHVCDYAQLKTDILTFLPLIGFNFSGYTIGEPWP
jgi:hypothetical protein